MHQLADSTQFDLYFRGHKGQNIKKLSGNYGGTNHNPAHRHLWSCVHRCQRLLMHPHDTPKTRSIWPTLWVKIVRQGKVGVNRHFKASWAWAHRILVMPSPQIDHTLLSLMFKLLRWQRGTVRLTEIKRRRKLWVAEARAAQLWLNGGNAPVTLVRCFSVAEF